MLNSSCLNVRRLWPFCKPVPTDLFHSGTLDNNARVVVRFLGTAGFVFEGAGHTIVVDPYVTRPNLVQHLSKLKPNEALVRRLFPRADEVLVGHSHSDHILDAPMVCKLTGARLIGSASARIVARAAGVPERQVLCTEGNEWIESGTSRLRGIPSLHGKAKLGPWIGVPLPGDVAKNFRWPSRASKFRHGAVLDWHVELAGCSIVHIDSADYEESQLRETKADVLCLCAAGWQNRAHYVSRAIELLEPKIVIPCHWDNFFHPYDAAAKQMSGVDLEGFIDEIKKNGIDPVLLPIGGEFGVL